MSKKKQTKISGRKSSAGLIKPARAKKDDGLTPEFHKDVLPNGVRVLTERHPVNRAISCGIWVNKGTRDENLNEAGLAHFVEHLVFKRTENRSAYEISRDMEAVGGDLNAFTSREYTNFITHSLKEDLALSLDVLSDLVCRPKFDAGDIKKEKQVVLQEIHMSEDQLEDHIFDRYLELAFPKANLGRPILGTEKSIAGMKRETVVDFHARQYVPENMIVSVAGNVDHKEVVELVRKHLQFTPKVSRSGNASAGKPHKQQPSYPNLGVQHHPVNFRAVYKKPSEQAHILIGLPSHDFRHPLRFEGFVVNSLLGGGMTSRLYQTVREDRGLVYSIYSQLVTFMDAGLNVTYAGTEPKKMPIVIDLVLGEIRKLRKNGVKRSDLDLFKTQVKGQILLGADDVENRMNSLGVNEMVFGKYRSVEDVIRDIEAISLDSLHQYIETFIDPEQVGILVMGQVPEIPTRKWLETL